MARRLSCLSWQEAGCLFILFYFKSLVMVWKNREKIQEIILYAIMKGNSSVIRELKYMSSHYWPISHLCSLSFDGVNREREGEGGREREHAHIWLKIIKKQHYHWSYFVWLTADQSYLCLHALSVLKTASGIERTETQENRKIWPIKFNLQLRSFLVWYVSCLILISEIQF